MIEPTADGARVRTHTQTHANMKILTKTVDRMDWTAWTGFWEQVIRKAR